MVTPGWDGFSPEANVALAITGLALAVVCLGWARACLSVARRDLVGLLKLGRNHGHLG